MSNDTKEFFDYFYEVYINSIIFNFDNIKIIINEKNLMQDKDFIQALINKISKMNNAPIYPKKVIVNLKKLIDAVSEFVEFKEYKELHEGYNDLISKEYSGEIYLVEYYKRFIEPEDIIRPVLYIENSDVNNSIMFDFAVLYSLIDLEKEININEYYLYSIKNFLYDFPEMFEDKTINKRALEILRKQEDSDLKERLIYKIKNIHKFIDNKPNYYNIRGAYKFILVQNMLINNDILKENISEIKTVIETLKDIIDSKLIDNEFERRNALEMLDYYKNSYKNEEEKKAICEEANEYIIKTNALEFEKEKMVSELYIRFGRFDLKKAFDNMENIDILIENDLRVMKYLLNGKDTGIYPEDAYLSIRKLLFMCPTLFDNSKVYDRATLLLNNNKKELRKVKKIYQG